MKNSQLFFLAAVICFVNFQPRKESDLILCICSILFLVFATCYRRWENEEETYNKDLKKHLEHIENEMKRKKERS